MQQLPRSIVGLRSVAAMGAMLVVGCAEYEPLTLLPFNPDSPEDTYCSIATAEIFIGSAQDAIPALTNPKIVAPGHPEAAYIRDDDRVVGIRAGADVLAIPLSLFRYHEIVNLDFLGGLNLVVTHCPLTGSSLAFDRGPAGDAEFGVSGLLYRNNLIMYDRNNEESLWPQMVRGARCGSRTGTSLQMHPVVEMTWSAWREMHPESWVVSSETGHPGNNYQVNPYGNYDEDEDVSWPTAIDRRRHPKERTLGVIDASGGVGYPFGELESLGPIGVVEHTGDTSAPGGTVVFWDGAGRSAMAYSRLIDATELTFSVVADQIVDVETSSTWRVDGVATSGPLAGRRLDEVAEAYVAFWFAWSGFETGQTLWEAP